MRVARRVQCLQSESADDQQFAALQAQVDERCRAGAMHDHWHIRLSSQLLTGGEMIRVRMGVDEIAYAQTISCGQCQVAVDLAELRIDERRSASLLAADDIGAAPAASHCFEYHCRAPGYWYNARLRLAWRLAAVSCPSFPRERDLSTPPISL